MKRLILTVLVAAGLTFVTPVLSKPAPGTGEPAGQVVARIGGKEISLPLMTSDYRVSVQGDVANVTVTQVFKNPTTMPLNATYLFPLNRKAAIHAMTMEVGDEVIKAVIKEKDDAKKTFEKAKSEGKAATLLTQHRPNMFTQNVANLMPGKPVKVSIDYVQSVPKIDDAYKLVIPMVVGPRYEGGPDGDVVREDVPADAAGAETVSGWRIDKLPAYPPVIGLNAPKTIDADRVGLALSVNAGLPISAMWSETHALKISGTGTSRSATFEKGRDIDNRDFVLRYELAAKRDIAAGVLSHYDEKKGGFLSLMVEPPKIPDEASATPRELVFVLDTSGSMNGHPMAASKAFMRSALRSLRPDDHFRILRFSNNTTQFALNAVRASEANKAAALDFVAGLSAAGGTEMNKAINAAFDTEQPANTMRIVVFLTDGYIGADRQVIRTIANRIGDARIYAFGIGNSVNRFLLDGMAREGRGYVRYVGVNESAFEAAEALAADLKTPLLTDVAIDWNGLDIRDQTPARVPDLFAGGSIRVFARYGGGGAHTIYVDGLVNGRKARMPVALQLPNGPAGVASDTKAIPLIWARERIFDKNRAYTIGGDADTRLKNEITRLGLDYSLQTRFTSFVAVSTKIVNDAPHAAANAKVPLPQASGVTAMAYPNLNLGGSSTPEPEGFIALLMALILLLARYRRHVGRRLSSLFARQRPVCRDLPKRLRDDGWWLEPTER